LATGSEPALSTRQEDDAPLPRRQIAAWATGAFGVSVLMNGISALSLFYFTVVLKLDPALAGLLIFAARIYDAVTDPLSGWLSDRSKSRLGRRRPFLLAGAIVSAVSFAAVFNSPFQGSGTATTAYVLTTLLLYTTGYSLFNVPYMAMPAEMTRSYHERSVIHGYRVASAAIGGLAVQMMVGLLLETFGKGPVGHSVLGYTGGALILVTMLVTFFGTARLPVEVAPPNSLSFRQQVRGFLANRPFQQVMGVKLVQLVGISSSSGGLLFFLANVIDRPLTLLPVIGLATTVGVLGATPLLLWLSRRIGKRGGYAVSASITGVAALSWALAQPGEPVWALVLRGFLLGIAFSGNVMFAMSMLADTMELDQHNTGLRREGTYSALYSFVEKLASSIGPLVLGGALSLAGFDPSRPPSEATPEVRQAVLLGIAYVPAAMAVLAVLILSTYRLDEAALRAARAAAAPGDGSNR
jgi:GPH family glycoside/pentoside/hexuronide:cation symporter